MNIREQKKQHGEALKKFFGLSEFVDAEKLVEGLQRHERRAHRYAEDRCNGTLSEAACDRIEASVLKQISAFGLDTSKVFINGDPRGYALKIREEFSGTFEGVKDWGGYGILGPEFTR